MNRLHTRALALLVTAALAASACQDEKTVAVGGGELPPPEVDTSTGLDLLPTPDPGPEEDTEEPIEMLREIVLLHDTTGENQVPISDQMQIRAKVIDYAQGGPAEGVPVGFSIVEGSDEGDASLATHSATTNSIGQVSVTFKAGLEPDAHYTVRLNANGADPVELDIYVVDTPKGSITVNIAYEGPINVQKTKVRAFRSSEYTCGMYNPINVPEGTFEKDLLALDQTTTWEGLEAGSKWTITATAKSPKGSLAASGCLDGVIVVGEQDNEVSLTMHLLALNPAGTYDANNYLDFTGAIPGEVGEIVDQITTLFTDPGKFLIDQIKALLSNWVPSIITDPVFDLFEDQLADFFTDWILNKSPEWLQDVFVIGEDLTQIIHSLNLLGTLKISKLHNDYYVQGVLYWDGIVLWWHYGCPKEDEPDYDPDCGRNEFSIDALSNTEMPQNVIEGKWTGSITNFDRLDIDNHTIKINYGLLIIFVLNEMILPEITGEDNLTDGVLALVNCPSIGESFSDGLLGQLANLFGIGKDDITDLCVDGVTLVVKPVELIIGNLALDSQLRLQGNAVMVDDDDDLVVDEIIEGEWFGHIEMDGTQGPQFDGTWEAVRVQ
ncbi:MAG: hypothetical protein ACQEXJ_17745 [Myxococcota bacterium]